MEGTGASDTRKRNDITPDLARLHHVLDDTFLEDRSPAQGSKNNLALIRKFAINILRLAQIQRNLRNCKDTKVVSLAAQQIAISS